MGLESPEMLWKVRVTLTKQLRAMSFKGYYRMNLLIGFIFKLEIRTIISKNQTQTKIPVLPP